MPYVKDLTYYKVFSILDQKTLNENGEMVKSECFCGRTKADFSQDNELREQTLEIKENYM